MKKLAVLLLLVVAVSVACSQKGFNASVDITPQPVAGVDFTKYRTWVIPSNGYHAAGVEHVDSPQFREAAARHFAAEMTKLGYTNSADSADLTILVHVSSEDKFDEQKMDDIYKGYDMAWTQMGDDDQWEEGTIVLFAMDSKTGQQLWSSKCVARMQEYVGYQDRLDRFNRVVTLMLEDFPSNAPPAP